MQPGAAIEVFSTCPPSGGEHAASYLRRVVDVARWSDEAGCRGILVYADNSQVDPWLVSQIIMQSTKALRSEEHTSELQSLAYLVCRLLLEKKKKMKLLTMTNLSTKCLIPQTKLGYDATPDSQILQPTATIHRILSLWKGTVAEAVSTQHAATTS